MHTIRMENFRSFKKVSARLAPLTLLVGENNTGKTDFMGIIRAMRQIAYSDRIPNFYQFPYDLGTFDNIVHQRGPRHKQPDNFRAGFDAADKNGAPSISFDWVFENNGNWSAIPVKQKIVRGEVSKEAIFQPGEFYSNKVTTSNGSWSFEYPKHIAKALSAFSDNGRYMMADHTVLFNWPQVKATPLQDSPDITEEDLEQIRSLFPPVYEYMIPHWKRTFANAPTRAQPQRVYDPRKVIYDPEGYYIPHLLAEMSGASPEQWGKLKKRLEEFGSESGMFDEIIPSHYDKKKYTGPFQILLRKFSGGKKGATRNLVDMGYGVSQVLPIITELLNDNDDCSMFLLQNPETNLHPRVHAALGSLFCQNAAPDRQIIVETHSDFLLDRVRMDIRDGDTLLKPEDVSILYFERKGYEVNVHSIRTNQEGRILDAPPSYRRFFREEVNRSVWKKRSKESDSV